MASLIDVLQSIQSGISELARRIRNLENQDHGPRIYLQPNDPAALEGVGDGALWINTGTDIVYRRSTDDTTWVVLTSGPGGMANPMTTLGDIITALGGGTPTRLGIGSAGEVLTVNAGVPAWDPIPTHDILSATHDDTTISAPNDQDVLTWDDGTSRWIAQALPASAPHDILSVSHSDTTISAPNDNDVLTWDSGSGTWVAAPIPAQTTVANDPIWDAAGDLAVGSGANTAAKLGIGSAGEVLTVVAGAPSWEPLPASGAHDILSATHSDTTVSVPSDQDVLTWDTATSKWIAQAPPGGTGADPELAIMNLLGWA